MKRKMIFEWNTDGRWARLSGMLMGIAIFAQALDYLALRQPGSVAVYPLLVMLILPLVLETVWCVCLRLIRLKRAEVYGIFGAVFCLLLLLQSFFSGSLLLKVLFCVLLLVAGSAMVMISWGFFPRRFLGGLVLFLVTVTRIATMAVSRFVGGHDWIGFLNDLPSICILLALTCFFGSLKPAENA